MLDEYELRSVNKISLIARDLEFRDCVSWNFVASRSTSAGQTLLSS